MTENTIPDKKLFLECWRLCSIVFQPSECCWEVWSHSASQCFLKTFSTPLEACVIFSLSHWTDISQRCARVSVYFHLLCCTLKGRSTSFISEIFLVYFLIISFPLFSPFPLEVKFLHDKCSPGLIWLSHLLFTLIFNLSVSFFYFNEN